MTPDEVPWRERSALVRSLRLLRTRQPRTFTEKVRYKMLRDHRHLLVTFADKVAVRDHVRRLIGSHHLPRAIAVIEHAEQLVGVHLPDHYVVKPTHGSGACIVVSPSAPADARMPPAGTMWGYTHVRPEWADRGALVDTARFWMSQLYGQGPNREWAYGGVPPRVIIEEMLVAPDGGIPDDLKFFVFHGRCRFIQVDGGRFGARTQDFFDRSWQHLELSGGPAWARPEPPRPRRLAEMLSIAETLGGGTDFVRVDLYQLPDRVVFGELTSYPAGGDSPFHPVSFDLEFGRYWTVPRSYR